MIVLRGLVRSAEAGGFPGVKGGFFYLPEPLEARSLPIELFNRPIADGKWHHCDRKAHQNVREVQFMAGEEALTKNKTGSRLLLDHRGTV